MMRIEASKHGVWPWVAVDAANYDGATDSHPISRAQGTGDTEPQAVVDLLDQLDEAGAWPCHDGCPFKAGA